MPIEARSSRTGASRSTTRPSACVATTACAKPTWVSERMLDPLIEREYNLRIRHPERDAVYARFASTSAALRARWPGFRTIPYGDSPRQAIDFFPAPSPKEPAPLFVFVHGGYWRALEPGTFSFLAEPWLARGVHVALPGYDLAPRVGVRTIAAQVRRALEHLLEAADALGIDSANVVVGGHSAGAHLGALVLGDMPRGTARGFAGVSGVYALPPPPPRRSALIRMASPRRPQDDGCTSPARWASRRTVAQPKALPPRPRPRGATSPPCSPTPA